RTQPRIVARQASWPPCTPAPPRRRPWAAPAPATAAVALTCGGRLWLAGGSRPSRGMRVLRRAGGRGRRVAASLRGVRATRPLRALRRLAVAATRCAARAADRFARLLEDLHRRPTAPGPANIHTDASSDPAPASS